MCVSSFCWSGCGIWFSLFQSHCWSAVVGIFSVCLNQLFLYSITAGLCIYSVLSCTCNFSFNWWRANKAWNVLEFRLFVHPWSVFYLERNTNTHTNTHTVSILVVTWTSEPIYRVHYNMLYTGYNMFYTCALPCIGVFFGRYLYSMLYTGLICGLLL